MIAGRGDAAQWSRHGAGAAPPQRDTERQTISPWSPPTDAVRHILQLRDRELIEYLGVDERLRIAPTPLGKRRENRTSGIHTPPRRRLLPRWYGIGVGEQAEIFRQVLSSLERM